jgi:hypothetical protein
MARFPMLLRFHLIRHGLPLITIKSLTAFRVVTIWPVSRRSSIKAPASLEAIAIRSTMRCCSSAHDGICTPLELCQVQLCVSRQGPDVNWDAILEQYMPQIAAAKDDIDKRCRPNH